MVSVRPTKQNKKIGLAKMQNVERRQRTFEGREHLSPTGRSTTPSCSMSAESQIPCQEAGLKIIPDLAYLRQVHPWLGDVQLIQVALHIVSPSFLRTCLGPNTDTGCM